MGSTAEPHTPTRYASLREKENGGIINPVSPQQTKRGTPTMQLSYRGLSYNADNTLPEMGSNEMNGQYRGATIKMGSHTAQVTQPTATLRYRGASYNH